jgi:hypothetical protein
MQPLGGTRQAAVLDDGAHQPQVAHFEVHREPMGAARHSISLIDSA